MNKRAALMIAGGVAAGYALQKSVRSRREPRLTGQVVLITGGSRGLGLALARAFARERCRIAICARDLEELRRAQEDLQRRGAEVLHLQCNISDRAQVERTIQLTIGHYGSLDILVNDAGEIEVGPVESMGIESFERAMEVMFWGTVYPTLAVLPHMLSRHAGRIVNITSIGGKVAVPHLLPYSCAKFAAVGFSEGLRAEVNGKGIKVITIAPGLMRTGSHWNASFRGDQDREATWFSLGASLPGISMSADQAAKEILEATRRGEAERILSTPANLMARLHGLFPGATADLLGVAARLLLPQGRDRRAVRGADVPALRRPAIAALTVLGRLAADRFNQPAKPRPEWAAR